MANVRGLKKNIQYGIGEIIDAVYIWEFINGEIQTEKSNTIINDALKLYDDAFVQINAKNIENKKKYFKNIHKDFETNRRKLISNLFNLDS